ncbi:hypothetical protein F5Y16DRAFT_249921 [Xylariaceae sp. FL0255]|nr:hypothetical protein F5Y16DRAFT_249921 [Xylariaceae sp. FL0255]
MTSQKTLVVGGGLAGPAATYWLSQIPGFHVTLLERSSSMRTTGQQLDLRVRGIDVMRKMGIDEALRAVRVLEPGVQLIDTTGREQAFFPVADHGGGRQSMTSEYEIMRADFVRILYDLTKDSSNVRHVFGQSVRDFTQDDESIPHGKVHVTFSSGQQEDFDMVVCADGTGSKTRKIMLGPDAPDPRHRTNGGYIGYFSIPSQPQDSDRFTMCLLPGKTSRVIATRKDCKELTRVYMITSRNDPGVDAALKSGDLTEMKNALSELYKDAKWETKRFMDGLLTDPEADDLYITPYEEVHLPVGSWSKGRVVCIGDAAHSGTANGYGTSWSLIGAYIMAGEIATRYEKDQSLPASAIIEATKKYEEIFRPIATMGHGKGNSWVGDFFHPRSEFAIGLIHKFAAAAAYFRLDQRLGFDGQAGKWQLPEYPALGGQH